LIGRVKVRALQQHLRELRKNPATIDKVVPSSYGRGATVLQLAARYNELEVLQGLLQAGADPNAKQNSNNMDQTALHEAVRLGYLEVVKALIAKGADTNQPDKYGNTPFHLAAIHDKVKVLQALLEAGADPNAKNSKTGLTALHEAVEEGHLEVIKELIAKGADINQTDNKGNTPLHTAVSITFSSLPMGASGEDLEARIDKVLNLLTEYPKINLNVKNNRRETPFDIATRRRFYDWYIAGRLKNVQHNKKP